MAEGGTFVCMTCKQLVVKGASSRETLGSRGSPVLKPWAPPPRWPLVLHVRSVRSDQDEAPGGREEARSRTCRKGLTLEPQRSPPSSWLEVQKPGLVTFPKDGGHVAVVLPRHASLPPSGANGRTDAADPQELDTQWESQLPSSSSPGATVLQFVSERELL